MGGRFIDPTNVTGSRNNDKKNAHSKGEPYNLSQGGTNEHNYSDQTGSFKTSK